MQQGRCSIVVSIPACHAGDPGSIPGNGAFFFFGMEVWCSFQSTPTRSALSSARPEAHYAQTTGTSRISNSRQKDL